MITQTESSCLCNLRQLCYDQAGAQLITVIQAGGGGEGLRHGVCRSRQPAMGVGGIKDGPWAQAWVAGCPELCVKMLKKKKRCSPYLAAQANGILYCPSLWHACLAFFRTF